MSKIQRILTAAISHVLHTCALGASNKSMDIKKTNGWVFFSSFRYNSAGSYVKNNNEWTFAFVNDNPMIALAVDLACTAKFPGVEPLTDPRFALKERHKNILLFALLARENRMGNCYSRCCVMAKYLWENNYPEIHRIEILSFNFVHFVVVVNRTGDLDEPDTWGNAFIVESWYPDQGRIYSPQELRQQATEVRQFIKADLKKQHQLGVPGRLDVLMATDWEDMSWDCYAEICPSQHKYPTYSLSPFRPLEYYYEPNYTYTAEIFGDRKNADLLADDRLIHQGASLRANYVGGKRNHQ